MPTDTKESGFESLIVNWLVEQNGYESGSNSEYNRDYALDEIRLPNVRYIIYQINTAFSSKGSFALF
jgi:hypothetical protein